MALTDNEIIERILIKLDGWVLSDNLNDDTSNNINESDENIENTTLNIDEPVNNTDNIEEILNENTNDIIDDLTYNKKISSTEILQFYDDATEYIKSYLQRTDTDNIPVYETAIIFWTAGLIWETYNQKENNMLDDTNPNPWGYGDKLVIQAKEMLKPYKSYVFNAF